MNTECLLAMMVVMCLCLASTASADQKRLTLTDSDSSKYRIVVAADADGSVKAAAGELQLHLEQMTGVKLEVVADSEPEQPCEILVGPSARSTAPDLQKLESEGWIIKTVGTKLIIAGGLINGTLNGVYTFLEDHLGCRWYAPDCAVVPRRKRLQVGPLDIKGAPVFEARMTIGTNATDPDWATRMRLNGLVPGSDPRHEQSLRWAGGSSHSLAALLPVDRYFGEHPEYFSEINGKRVKDYTQVCTTNADATRIITEHALEWLKSNPGAKMLSVTANDWNNQCECAYCRASNEKYSVTGTWLRFVNAIAEGIEKDYPSIIVDTFAYTWTVKPPKGVKARKNVAIRYAPIESCSYHRYDDSNCAVNVEEHAADYLKAWTKISPRVWVWYYILEGAQLQPYPAFNCLSANVKLIRDLGGKGFSFLQNRPYGSAFYMHSLKGYLCAKVMWDPEFDVQRGIDEFCKAYYGRAGRAMAAYVHESQDERAYQRAADGSWLQPLDHKIAPGVPDRVPASNLWFRPWNGIAGKPGFHLDFVSAPAPRQDLLRKWFKSFAAMERAVASDPTLLRRVRTERLTVLWCCLLFLPPEDPIRKEARELFLPMALETKLLYIPDLRKFEKFHLTPENVQLLKKEFPEFCPTKK